MSKKSLNRKVARKIISDSREMGKSDQEIYNELSQEYHDKKSVALLITGTVTRENKEKYKSLNSVLVGLLLFAVLLRILLVFRLTAEAGQLWQVILIFFVPLFAAYFAYEIATYHGPAYRFCGIITIVGFMRSIGKTADATDIIINLVFAGAIAGLAFYLDNKMFPDYSPKSLEKDEDGEYILNRQ